VPKVRALKLKGGSIRSLFVRTNNLSKTKEGKGKGKRRVVVQKSVYDSGGRWNPQGIPPGRERSGDRDVNRVVGRKGA